MEALAADIKERGLVEPVVVVGGKLLDGRNRVEACRRAGVKVRVVEYRGKDPVGQVVSLNLQRRHLNESQRAMVASKLANMPAHRAHRARDKSANLRTSVSQPEAARLFNVSTRSIQSAKAIQAASPERAGAVERGEMTLNQAVREVKREEQAVKLESVSVKAVKAVAGVYDVVVVDPPWPMEKIERDCRPNQVSDLDYPTMSEAELYRVSIPVAPDCHVWLWTTHRFLPMAFRLLEGWRLKYVCAFVWHKPGGFQPMGLPQYNCEFALYARKGSPVFVDTRALPVCFEAPRGKHSEKPEDFYAMVRRVTAGRRVDMFNRREIEGFDGWGNQAV